MKIDEIKNTKKWEKNGITRYYFQSGYARKGSAFASEDRPNTKYVWICDGFFIGASKPYNGAVQDDLKDIFQDVEPDHN